MNLNWTAILSGFAVVIVLAIVSGLIYAGTNATTVVLYWGTIGVLGGLTAGYLAGGPMGDGALHGAIATTLGSLITLAIVTLTTLLFAGMVATFGVLFVGLLLIGAYAIPGAFGGAVGSWIKDRREAPVPVKAGT